MYEGVLETTDACGKHRREYHRLLLPFKAGSSRRQPLSYYNDRVDDWGQAWQPRQVRHWLRRFQGIDVSDRARLHPVRHIEPWKAAAAADKDLLEKVRAHMAAEQELRMSAAKGRLAHDPDLQEKVQRARGQIREAKASEAATRDLIFLEPSDEAQ